MAAVTSKQLDGAVLAAGTPTSKLSDSLAVGDFLVVEVIQSVSASPGPITDSLGNTYQQVFGFGSIFSALGYALYTCRVTTGGNRPTLTLNLGAPGVYGLRGYTNVSATTDSRGRPTALGSVSIGDRSATTVFSVDGTPLSVGDMVVALVCCLGNVTFTLDPTNSTANWTEVAVQSLSTVSYQLLEASPADASDQIATWTASPAIDTILSSVVLRHS